MPTPIEKHADLAWKSLESDQTPISVEARTITLSTGETEILPEPVARLRNKFKRRDDYLRETYGVDPWACAFCDGTGLIVKRANPDDQIAPAGSFCGCRSGENVAETEKRAKAWKEIVPKRMQDWRLETCPDKRLVEKMWEWINAEPLKSGWGLVFTGEPGRAKTGVCIGALRHFYEFERVSVAYYPVQELLDATKEGFDDRTNLAPHQRPIYRATHAQVLLLDDLGAERVTDWSAQAIDSILRQRYDNERPTLITSNLTGEDFRKRVGPRLLSRLKDSATAYLASGIDYRETA